MTDVLGTKADRQLVAFDNGLDRSQISKGGMHSNFDLAEFKLVQPKAKVSNQVKGFMVIKIEFPVAGNQRVSHHGHPFGAFEAARSAASPGRSPCSMNSRLAPPPVDMKEI